MSPGVVTVYENDGAAKKFFVSSGSITINEDASVQILAEEAHSVENLGNFIRFIVKLVGRVLIFYMLMAP